MRYHLAFALALVAILLQTAQPLLAAMVPASRMAQTAVMAQPCAGADAAYAALSVASHHTAQPSPVHDGGGYNMGCCCHGPWSCGGPCGMLALGARPVTPAVSAAAHCWLIPPHPRVTATHPLELLRPPIVA